MNKSSVENPKEWKFIIRAYAIIVSEKNEVLLSDEFYNGTYMTKFPGGGVEFGEGTIDCLKREALEEFGQEVEVIQHFYTTDFFQTSLFHEKSQLISIYYLAKFTCPIQFKLANKAFEFTTPQNGSISFRWKLIEELTEEDVTFPIDKHVVGILKIEPRTIKSQEPRTKSQDPTAGARL